MTWFNKLPTFFQTVAEKIGYISPVPETLCNWDDLKCHYDKLKPILDICRDNTCLLQNLFEYGSKYDKSAVYGELTRKYLPYMAIGALTASLVVSGIAIRQQYKKRAYKKKSP
jgi:hypothetical protein